MKLFHFNDNAITSFCFTAFANCLLNLADKKNTNFVLFNFK